MAINFAVAKYAGTCSKCRGSIPVNSTFVWGPYGSKTRFHPECAPAAKPAPAPAPDGQQPTVETVLETARVWSEHQTRFFTEATDGLQNLLVIAVAGSGKTTALVEASRRLLAKRATTTIKYFVFNKSNAREAEKKMPQAVDSSTFHRAGNAAVAARIGRRYQVKANKVNRLLGDFVQHGTVSEYEADAFGSEVCKLVGLGKVHLIGATMPDTIENWKHLIDHFGIDFDVDPDEWAERGAPGMDAEDRAIAIAQKLLAASNADLSVLDYDDQLYLPIKMHLPMPRFDVVMADEAQDTNPARRAILRKTLKPGGKLMGVGDPRQAIYGFCHPPGTLVRTPEGFTAVEDLRAGDPVIIASTGGDVSGWTGGQKVVQTHVYDYDEELVSLEAAGKSAEMTLHHRVPVKMDPHVRFFTYMMVRCGVYRVGYMAAYGSAGEGERRFMLSQRCVLEGADAAWILSGHEIKEAARVWEDHLLKTIKGTTFNLMSDDKVSGLPPQKEEAEAMLRVFGRRVEFPFWVKGRRQDFKANYPFITEACNIMDGMRVAALDETRWDDRRRGRSRQRFEWNPVRVSRRYYIGKTYGITVPALHLRSTYSPWPLYFAGDGLLVHNTGADADAMDLIRRDFDCKVLPLSVNYRSGTAIIDLAKTLCPEITARPGAPTGTVETRDAFALADFRQTDAIICRVVAPLITIAYRCIAKQIPCVVLGRDIGAGLIALIQKLNGKRKQAITIDELLTRADVYLEREIARWTAKGEEDKVQSVIDKVESIKAAIEALPEGRRSVNGLIEYIDSIFGEVEEDEDGKKLDTRLTLCSIHKSKGLEWERVFVLDRHRMPSKWARQEWQKEQEQNLQYVAYTRAMESLIFIDSTTVR